MGVDSSNRLGSVGRAVLLSVAFLAVGCKYGPSPAPFTVPSGATSACNGGPRVCKDLFTAVCENGCVEKDLGGDFSVKFEGDDGCDKFDGISGNTPKGAVLEMIGKDLDLKVGTSCQTKCTQHDLGNRPEASIKHCS
ncbi:MAG: hypothetical protein WCT46_06660 [Candidatus Gracilibacteria bacterium]|jgi:hypothetical protein